MSDYIKKLRVGVVGVGTMGRHHIRIVSESPDVSLAGLYDPDTERAAQFCDLYGCTAFENLDELLAGADAVSVAAPTSLHVEIGERVLERGVHLLMEKPLAHDVRGAERLVKEAREAGVVLMAGHVERYNPAIQKLMEMLGDPKEQIISIDARRLAPFDGSRCLDVDVLSDLLIHDIDLALEIADSPIAAVSASGRPVFSTQTDVAYARVDFENGATAVFWTGKCSPKKVRSLTVTTHRRFFEADTLTNSLVVHMADALAELKEGICFMTQLSTEEIEVPPQEPLKAELEDFFAAVRGERTPVVTGERALQDLKALEWVRNAMQEAGRTNKGGETS